MADFNPFEQEIINTKALNSIFVDIFHKLDNLNQLKLNFSQIQSLLNILDSKMKEDDFKELTTTYGDLKGKNIGYLTKDSFVKFLDFFFDKLEKEQKF